MPTPDEMIAQYVSLRDFIADEKQAHEAKIAPFEKAMDVIAQALLQHLKSQHGTAYKQLWMRAKVDDRDAFLQFCMLGNWDFADLRVLKEPVEKYLEEENQALPPGVTVERGVKCNVRRT